MKTTLKIKIKQCILWLVRTEAYWGQIEPEQNGVLHHRSIYFSIAEYQYIANVGLVLNFDTLGTAYARFKERFACLSCTGGSF